MYLLQIPHGKFSKLPADRNVREVIKAPWNRLLFSHETQIEIGLHHTVFSIFHGAVVLLTPYNSTHHPLQSPIYCIFKEA